MMVIVVSKEHQWSINELVLVCSVSGSLSPNVGRFS